MEFYDKELRGVSEMGLDPTNNNPLSRANVIHSAWHANDDMIPAHGKLGRR